MYGVDSHYFDVYGYYVQWGRNFTEEDFASFRKVAILDRDAVSSLYGSEENPVGTTLEIRGEPFTVIGAMKAANLNPIDALRHE